ncbi:MAG: penicillin acylase family protein [Bryobacteraceae bacterium]|nr:penicillin acylase family protein [Bryobacteraceae bacterium]
MLKIVFRIVNTLLAAAALAALGAGYWLVWRPGGGLSGEVAAPVRAEVRIVRDGMGVPHIEAGSIEDALFAQGYATAQDRLWQMDSLRRLAAGELAEIAGRVALELDIRARQLRMRRIAERWAETLPAEQRAQLAAYARGVNHFLEQNLRRLPPEFTLLGYAPRPWRVADTLLCALQMNRTLSGNWEHDLLKHRMLRTGRPELVEQLFPARLGTEPLPGSNAWAVSGQRTATGKPLLANDPHLPWTQPATWHLVHLKAPGLNVAGAALPGIPGIVIGRNGRLAWGITALQFDNMDLYIEKLDMRTGRYEHAGRVMQAVRETERIAVKGGQPAQLEQWVTVHGPVILEEEGRPMALRWSAAEIEGAEFPVLEWNRAQNAAEFRAALGRLPGPNINVLFADADGNTGWQTAGRLPVREGFDGSTPVDGASGRFEWKGFVPFEQMPFYSNPKNGLLVSANHNPFPENTPYSVSGFFSSPDRALQITRRLEAAGKLDAEKMMAVQMDVYSALHHGLARAAVEAAKRRGETNEAAREGARLLEGWDGQMRAGSAAAFLAHLLYQHVRRAIGERASPKHGAGWRTFLAPGVVARIVGEKRAEWFDNFDLMLSNALADAVEEGRRMQGRRMEKWRYGRANQVSLAHPVMGRIPWLGGYFNFGPVEMDGAATTVRAVTEAYGPSMRFVADPSDADGTWIVIPTGNSGHRLTGHYGDQWKAYLEGRAFRLALEKFETKQMLRLVPEGKR